MCVPRGCGASRKGGIYFSGGTGAGGVPGNRFLVDPVKPIDPEDYVISSLGQVLIQPNPPDGPYHILDLISKKDYPNMADYFEETIRFGWSRHGSINLDYSKIDQRTRLLIAHPRGFLQEPESGWLVRTFGDLQDNAPWLCPSPSPAVFDRHQVGSVATRPPSEPYEFCVGLGWEYLFGGTPFIEVFEKELAAGASREELYDHAYHWAENYPAYKGHVMLRDPVVQEWLVRPVRRTMPSFTYWGNASPFSVEELEHLFKPGVFLSLPVHQIQIVHDENEPEKDAARIAAAEQSRGIPVEVTEE